MCTGTAEALVRPPGTSSPWAKGRLSRKCQAPAPYHLGYSVRQRQRPQNALSVAEVNTPLCADRGRARDRRGVCCYRRCGGGWNGVAVVVQRLGVLQRGKQ